MTKTNTVKHIDEGYLYAVLMSDNGHISKFCVTGSGSSVRKSGDVSYSSGEVFVIPRTSILAEVDISVGETGVAEAIHVNFPAGTPAFHAKKSSGLASMPAGYPLVPYTTVTAILSGAETTIPVISTKGYFSSGTITVGATAFSYTSITSTTFVGGTPLGVGYPVGTGVTIPTKNSLGLAGMVFDIVTVPTITSADLIDYATAMSSQPQVITRDVRDRGVLKSRKRMLNHDKSLSITKLFQNDDTALMALMGMDLALKLERQDDMAGLTTEELYFFQAYGNRPEQSESAGDNDSDIVCEFNFQRYCIID
jgi:hypothetical protein